MKKYKIKSEAVSFFKKELSTTVGTWDLWEKYQVDINALEEVLPPYLTYGHKFKDRNGATLSGWDSDSGKHIHFTVFFPSMKLHESDVFAKGSHTRQLMDMIQKTVYDFYEKFNDQS